MKILIATIASFLGLTTMMISQTAQITLVKPNRTPYIYTKFDSAYVHAANGDFIYLPGGYFTVANPINKSIHIFGAGYNQDSSSATGITTLDKLIIYHGAVNGSIQGLKINNGNGCDFGSIKFGDVANSNPISGYSISNCNIVGGLGFYAQSTNITIRNNLIGGHSCGSNWISLSGGLSNSLISNNIITGHTAIGETPALFFSNNIFFYANIYISPNLPYYSTYENNIFQNGITWYVSYSTFNNNTNGSFNGTDNLITNQLNEAWSLIFIAPGPPSGGYYYYDVHNNYHVKTDSGCHNSGTDGTDRGIYGGVFPWIEGSIPSNPHIYFKDIDQLTGPDGKLHIEVGVRTNN